MELTNRELLSRVTGLAAAHEKVDVCIGTNCIGSDLALANLARAFTILLVHANNDSSRRYTQKKQHLASLE